jgi:hypothetical protein
MEEYRLYACLYNVVLNNKGQSTSVPRSIFGSRLAHSQYSVTSRLNSVPNNIVLGPACSRRWQTGRTLCSWSAICYILYPGLDASSKSWLPTIAEARVRARINPCGMWWRKWHWDRFISQFFGCPLSTSFHSGSSCSCIIWGMNNRPVAGRSSETSSHPIVLIKWTTQNPKLCWSWSDQDPWRSDEPWTGWAAAAGSLSRLHQTVLGLTCGQHIESHSCIFSFPNRTVTSLFK